MFVLSVLGRVLGRFSLILCMLLAAAWVAGALFFDGPLGNFNVLLSAGVLLALLAAVFFVRPQPLMVATFLAICGGVAGWWLTLEPRSDRHWQADVAQMPWAETEGEVITLHNLRHCDYRSESDYTPRWETRTVRLSQLTGLDFLLSYQGSRHLAHPIASFQFADSPPVCFSIEPRQEAGETYSPLAGFFRRYELACVMADERDVVRVRTHFRPSGDVYLYRSESPPAAARALFIDYLHTANQLHKEARWYHALIDHCATNVRLHCQAIGAVRLWDWRLFFNGHMDERARPLGARESTLPFAEFKRLSRINDCDRATGNAANYSARIRESLPESGGRITREEPNSKQSQE